MRSSTPSPPSGRVGGRQPSAWWRRLSDPEGASSGSAVVLGPALSWLRWTIVATMLLIVLAWPVPGRTGQQLWTLVLAFALYNVAVELGRRSVPRLRSFAWVPYADLPVAGLLYFLDAEPGGPLFVAFYLAVVTAAACWPLRRTMVYVAAVVVVVVAVAPTLPQWSASPGELRQLAARLVVLSLVGVGTAVLVRRLSGQEALAKASRDEAERLEALDRLRDDFIASVSHDLRTPLTAVRAGLGLLDTSADDRFRPEERDLLGNARRNVDRLVILVDDLLTSNQLEAGVLVLDREPLDLRAIVADSVATVHLLLRQKGQEIELDLPEPLPVEGDARRLTQVAVNLLGNAHAHTPRGARIAVSGRAADGQARLTIADDGPGIPPEELEAVFRRFHRGRSTGGGSGLGLAIARPLVELHGGRVWVESGPDPGAVFHLTLPLRDRGTR